MMDTIPENCHITELKGWRSMVLPFLNWWPHVTRKTLKNDLLADLTGSIVACPKV